MKEDKYYIDRILNGDVNAFSLLVDKHKNLVFTIALRMLKNSEDAEELSQDTFVKAYNSLKEFKFESKFSTWLYRITYNGAISRLRKKQIEITNIESGTIVDSDVISSYNAINELKRNEQKKYINQVIENLREEDAFLITMYYLNESSIEEISEITGFSISNVKVKLFRARKRFYNELKVILKEEVTTIL
ncbi:MAG: sigma-70 family RNA polymerase sigma factor [Bacteroidales bacterium]|nr:sigma-70 family RNA polymerase sigma factor [Bacteroidales bacterium]